MRHSDVDQLRAEAAELIERALRKGAQMERARIFSLLSDEGGAGAEIAAPRRRRARGASSSGPIAWVRKALIEMPTAAQSVDAAEVLDFVSSHYPEFEITEKRVRGALKQLVNTGEVRRGARGRYCPSVSAPSAAASGEEKPGDDELPGSFDLLAAE